mmetsp:Transcript_13753/g.50075  ORF Transcript_13753/g.50075 Transcript_13753/m.50075 type:complete len:412 (+) Transcript_13753:192-1427(+)
MANLLVGEAMMPALRNRVHRGTHRFGAASGGCYMRRAAQAPLAVSGSSGRLRLRVSATIATEKPSMGVEGGSQPDSVVNKSSGSAHHSLSDILAPVRSDMEILQENLQNVVGNRNPTLVAAAKQIFGAGGKRMRPAICLLVARATMPLGGMTEVCEKHRRIAEITEMIHTASLVHDDVLDECSLRRGKETINSTYGSRLAVLAGDFLFAQSSWGLAQLENLPVIKLISQVIADFANGEIEQAAMLYDTDITLEQYTDKSFWKTASLIAASSKSAAIFSDVSEEVAQRIYDYGRHLGIAFQIVDDILDFTSDQSTLGKEAGQDLASGNLTAPTIFAMAKSSELVELIESEYQEDGSFERALELVHSTGGIEDARRLAREEGDKAIACLQCLPPSESKAALEEMVEYVLQRIF